MKSKNPTINSRKYHPDEPHGDKETRPLNKLMKPTKFYQTQTRNTIEFGQYWKQAGY
jgi:hypothetical protein